MPCPRIGLAVATLLLSAPADVPGQAPPTPVVPKIPLCTGLTLVTAVNDTAGDYESIKTIESLDDKQLRLVYATQKVDYGNLLSLDPPKLRFYESRRTVLLEDLKTSRAYLQEFQKEVPELAPGTTALGTSADVLAELKAKGEADFGISFWAFPIPLTLDPNNPESVYRKQMKTRNKVLEKRVMLPVLVNGQPFDLPAVHTRGDFLGYISEFWFLDQPDNPLTLKFRIGIGEKKPISAEEREKCKKDPKIGGYPAQQCLNPDGGDTSTLDMVKINFRCGAGETPPGGGSGGGAGPAGGAGAGSGRGAPAGGAPGAGALPEGSGAAQLENALEKENRVEIFDIFFAFDSDEIRKESEPRLRDIAEVLKRHPDWKLKVEGHTDNIAPDDYNLKLSQRRAAAVKNALVGRYGIAATHLTPEGLGESRPRSPNDTMTGRARNRRVELVRQSTHSSG